MFCITRFLYFHFAIQLLAAGIVHADGGASGPAAASAGAAPASPEEEAEPPPAPSILDGPAEKPASDPVAAPASVPGPTGPTVSGPPDPPAAAPPPADPSGSELDLFRLDASLNAAVVTASGGAEEERSTALANVFTISRADILSRGYRSVAEILGDVPGLYVIDDLVMPSLSVRGVNGGLAAGTRIVKVMINGHAVAFRPELSAFLGPELIPIDAIERVEVAKGLLSSPVDNPPPLYPTVVAGAGIDIDVPEAYLHLHGRAKVVGPRGPSQSSVFLNNGERYELPTYVVMDMTLSTKGLHPFGPSTETRFLASARNVSNSRWIEPGFAGIDLPNVGQTYFFECKQTF